SGVLVRVRERFVAHRRIVRATAVALVIAVAGGLSAGGVVAAHRLTAPLPAAGVVIHASRSIVLTEGSPPPITLPPTGSLAVVSSATGLLAAVSSDVPRPIASVAKTMTAFVVLQAEPLTTDAPGPVLTMTATDVALYREAIAGQGSAVAVTAGERLSERDLLLMLMLPSANNIAETLARWVSGTRDTFVARENAEAAALGLQNTPFLRDRCRSRDRVRRCPGPAAVCVRRCPASGAGRRVRDGAAGDERGVRGLRSREPRHPHAAGHGDRVGTVGDEHRRGGACRPGRGRGAARHRARDAFDDGDGRSDAREGGLRRPPRGNGGCGDRGVVAALHPRRDQPAPVVVAAAAPVTVRRSASPVSYQLASVRSAARRSALSTSRSLPPRSGATLTLSRRA